MEPKVAAVAIRGTLADGECEKFPGSPLDGAKELLERVAAAGYKLVIHDPLLNSPEGQQGVLRWLYEHELPFDDIYAGFGAMRADLYVNGLSVKEY